MTTYDDDHAAEKKKMGSELADVDVAAKVYDEEQRKRKGKAKIVYEEDNEESEKKSFFDHVPKKIRKALRNSQRQPHFENLNGASTSSSSPSSLTLPLENYIAEYNPPNPNFQSSPSLSLTRPKLRAVSQRESSGIRIKIPQVASFSRTVRKMPWGLVKVMSKMNGEDSRLIFEKTLFVTDVNPTQSHFSMPFSGLIRNDFLTPVERSIIDEDIHNDTKRGVEVILVDPRSQKWGVISRRWEMTSDSGNGSWSYSLTCGWNDVVKANDLKEGDNICVWSFRCRGILCFALVPLPLAMRV